MLQYFKQAGLVQYVDQQPKTWQEAIQMSCRLLLEQGYITQDYVDEIISCVQEYGPYICIAPHVAMPHASENSQGVLGTGIAFTKFPEAVKFLDESTNEIKEAQLFFTLAAKDSQAHLQNISNLMELLMEEDKVEALMTTSSMLIMIS
ncbi:PTS sugar transporter subunit IIA [Vaginisenegalia massiliensis]|uniref:PTS sugar transporter subunit IIA n=1 Tax=Vaginisenegalia massiliensis TaxID=2058294 RepID=UPI000F53E933|nr:PTS sugar transporter subunit IIA [Vaginisenegalia massiliensis]